MDPLTSRKTIRRGFLFSFPCDIGRWVHRQSQDYVESFAIIHKLSRKEVFSLLLSLTDICLKSLSANSSSCFASICATFENQYALNRSASLAPAICFDSCFEAEDCPKPKNTVEEFTLLPAIAIPPFPEFFQCIEVGLVFQYR